MILQKKVPPAEFLPVLAVLVLAAGVAWPTFRSVRRSANEDEAVATLKNVVHAQVVFHQQRKVDLDGDGNGEYAGLVELMGVGKGRLSAALSPPLLFGAI